MKTKCFECGHPPNFRHHVVPRSRGGTKTVPLCADCHGKAHHNKFNMDHSTLTKEGLQRARERGVKLGGSHLYNKEKMAAFSKAGRSAAAKIAKEYNAPFVEVALKMRGEGKTLQQIADHFNEQGDLTRRGNKWHATSITRLVGTNHEQHVQRNLHRG